MARRLSIFIDGAARGNPGPAGIGVVVRDEDGITLKEISRYIGEATNNIAEYNALLCGLQEALMLKADEVAIHSDSQLVARQISGAYRVKNKELKRLFDQALHLLTGFARYEMRHIGRELNKEADRLANKAINLSEPVT
ncbi:MAG: ribonuclease HI family protein [Candidatus Omnitrophota bacterium]